VDVIDHQMTLFDPAFLLFSQPMEHFPKIAPDLTEDHLPPALRDEDDVVFALPLRVT
jgi:hypothetical protein